VSGFKNESRVPGIYGKKKMSAKPYYPGEKRDFFNFGKQFNITSFSSECVGYTWKLQAINVPSKALIIFLNERKNIAMSHMI
jgi:hypothetical protein